MALNLDLSSAEAKIARAVYHRRLLERELKADLEENPPYASRFSDIDPQTGWCSLFLVPNKVRKPQFGIAFGDVIHNLRCALDYIVTELVKASNTTLTSNHQFPIYRDQKVYRQKVGSDTVANSRGPLCNVTRGLGLIEQLQPYHLKPEPRRDPLWHVHRFSNADKHRQIAAFVPMPIEGEQLSIDFEGTLVEKVPMPAITLGAPEDEIEIYRLRFDPPVARNLRTRGEMAVRIAFSTEPFGSERGLGIDLLVLREACDHVAMVAEQFKSL